MNPQRRRWLHRLATLSAAGLARPAHSAHPAQPAPATAPSGARAPGAPGLQRDAVLTFPADHGAHLLARTEWWYATGWLSSRPAPAGPAAGTFAGTSEGTSAQAHAGTLQKARAKTPAATRAEPSEDIPAATATDTPTHGFQVTFFRSLTGLAEGNASRFAARHLLFAHAAITPLTGQRHQHDQRIARWSGAPGAALGRARVGAGGVQLGGWALHDSGDAWRTQVNTRADAPEFSLDLVLRRTQPLLLQGQAGVSQKGPLPSQFSRYYSEPQLAVSGRVTLRSATLAAQGRAWLDHEWSDEYLPPGATGWDWVGFNLQDGSALTAFVLRLADGRALWAGGSFRAPGQAAQNFAADRVRFTPGRRWRSPGSGAEYPVAWAIDTPVGRFAVHALLDAQELDSRASTGTIYWEGLSELLDAQGRRVGLGYLEMTGYAAPLKLG